MIEVKCIFRQNEHVILVGYNFPHKNPFAGAFLGNIGHGWESAQHTSFPRSRVWVALVGRTTCEDL